MGKKKKKPKYYVDLFDGRDDEPLSEWKKFRSLKKAVAYAIKQEITEDRILDSEGHAIPDLDLDDPKWWNHRRLETEYHHAASARDVARSNLDRERDARRNWQVTMIRAGYVPIELLTGRLIGVSIEHTGRDDSTVYLTLAGNPGKEASQYRQRPFAAFLQALNEGLGK